ncbi:hypothetical protein CDAR_105721 [Caerostris darwini]|uniref:Secreted protein n=1 Tax=Caerostris darwini TaxID=1538125 RepID=A0AAV4TRD6_9ARAC|nr:hypothetical protein CDAR_105721 [Caerostris darwini]
MFFSSAPPHIGVSLMCRLLFLSSIPLLSPPFHEITGEGDISGAKHQLIDGVNSQSLCKLISLGCADFKAGSFCCRHLTVESTSLRRSFWRS